MIGDLLTGAPGGEQLNGPDLTSPGTLNINELSDPTQEHDTLGTVGLLTIDVVGQQGLEPWTDGL